MKDEICVSCSGTVCVDGEEALEIVQRLHDLLYVDIQPSGEDGAAHAVLNPDKSIEGADFVADVIQLMVNHGLHPKKTRRIDLHLP